MDFHIAVDIAAPPEVVWAVMADAERWHEWTPSVRSIRYLDPKPVRVGTRALIRQPRFPPAVWTVTELNPGRNFVWTSGAPGMRVFGHHSVDPVPCGSRATLRLYYQGALGGLFARMTRGITNRYLGYEANGLKARSEALAATPAARG